MRFQLLDGTEVTGRSYQDIVARMAADKFVEPRSLATYRRATAHRVADMYNAGVDASTDSSFIHSLEEAGLIKRLG